MDSVECVVVNYNAGRRLAECVRDLLAQAPPVGVTVADNASTDASLAPVERLARDEPRLRVVRNPSNLGYAAACNRAAREARGEYLAFVNPDCRLAEDALAGLREALEREPDAALAGALVEDPDGALQRGTRRRLPTPWRALMTFTGLERLAGRWPGLEGVNLAGPAPERACSVAAVNGACLLVRRSVFEALGGFDEGYFLHCEDLDLFRRLRDAGQGILLAPVRLTHHRGTCSASAPLRVHWHKHRGMLRYLRRHHARGADLPWLPLACLGIVARLVLLAPLVAAGRRRADRDAAP